MKKVKSFLKKADLVTYALVALLGVSTIFAWTQITGTSGTSNDELVVMPIPEREHQPVFNPIELPPVVSEVVIEEFMVPVNTTNYTVTTTFFDATSQDATALVSSLFFYQIGDGKYSRPSMGMSFTCVRNEVVEVIAPLSGVINSVIDDHPVYGTIITIDHQEGLQTVLTGVYNVNVEAGAAVEQGTPLGVTGLSRVEPEAGNVVHLEVLQAGSRIDPQSVIGRRVDEI